MHIINKTNILKNFLLDFHANFIGIKNGRWITKEYLKMKKILQAISCKF